MADTVIMFTAGMRILATVVAATAVTVLLAPLASAAPVAEQGRPAPGVQVTGFLGDLTLPQPTMLDGTTVGGLSGIDYDPRHQRFYAISDDRSQLQPARFYTADLQFTGHGRATRLTGADFSTTPWLRPDGSTYPPLSAGDGTAVDPEAIRYDPRDGSLYWTSEGERIVPTDGSAPTLIDPFLRQARTDGRYVRELGLPSNEKMTATAQGPRQNAVLEGLTLTSDGRSLLTAMEGPLLQDGPAATPAVGAPTRMTFMDKRSGAPTRQLVYPIEPVYAAPVPATGFSTTGVVDVLAVDRDRYLVMERSFSTGVGNRVRIYEITTSRATDVLATSSLVGARFTPVTKRLVLDLADLPLAGDGTIPCANGGCVDNVEGMTFGPRLPDGRRTLVMVTVSGV